MSIEQMLDRTVCWVASPFAVRWSPTKPPSADDILSLLVGTAPVLRVGADAAESPGGMVIARLATRVLARVFPGMLVRVDGNRDLERQLEQLAAEILPARHEGEREGIELIVGRPSREPRGQRVCIAASGWLATIASQPMRCAPSTVPGASALVAASLGTTEVLKRTLSSLGQKHGGRWTQSDLAPVPSFTLNTYAPGWSRYAMPPVPERVRLGKALVISAGALTNAMLAALLEDETFHAQLTVMDDDLLDVTNLNRYLLATWRAACARRPKTTFLAGLSTRGVEIRGVNERYNRGSSPWTLAIIGADRIDARHAAQADGHAEILNGATDPSLVRLSFHRKGSDHACLGCINQTLDQPGGDAMPTVATVSALAGGLMAAQLYRIATSSASECVVDVHPLQYARQGNLTRLELLRLESCQLCGSVAA